jgi:Restriction endonuclease
MTLNPIKYTDSQLEEKIENLKTIIVSIIGKYSPEGDDDYHFKSHSEHYDDEPSEYPCVLVLCAERWILDLLQGCRDMDLSDEIYDEIDKIIGDTGFYLEEDRFYVSDHESDLAKSYRDYFEWRWICDLITPDHSSLYEEIFDRFRKNPDELYKLSPRKYEEFLEVVFQNNGYRTLLGAGSNDGGVDLKLYTNDIVGESVTLVQAKRYKSENPIELQAVQALTAVVDDQKANRGLFVTTSRYLPCAKNFAARHNSRIQLASSAEVAEWCDSARNRIVRDKSSLVEFEQIKIFLQGANSKGLEGKIFHATWGYNCTRNSYAMIVKETTWLALLVRLPAKIHTHDGYEQNGTNLPDTSLEALSKIDKLHVFRAKKQFHQDKFSGLWGEQQFFSLWDGKPNLFNSD